MYVYVCTYIANLEQPLKNDREDITENPMEETSWNTKNTYEFTKAKLQMEGKKWYKDYSRCLERKKEMQREEGTE